MKRSGSLTRRTPLRSNAVPLHRAPVRRTGGDPVPAAVRRQVRARSGGLCELGCGHAAQHQHHRRMRSQGGRHEAVNLLDLCLAHHQAIHANPARSYALGLLVHGWSDPADVPVTRLEGITL